MEKTDEEKMEGFFYFCDEIEEEIMLRLPTKSLSRFNCVSKTWYSRITSSQFAHKKRLRWLAMAKNNNNNKKLNLMLHGGEHGPFHLVSCSSSSNYNFSYCDDNDDDAKKIPLLVDLNNYHMFRFNIVGSCDGLLLVLATTYLDWLTSTAYVIYIWNPTTGEYKKLPQLMDSYYKVQPRMASYSYLKSGSVFIEFGFGRDLTTDNNNHHYKVLLLETKGVFADVSSHPWKTPRFKVNMYTTHTNSWKTLLPIAPFRYLYQHPTTGMILAYDNLHFLAQIDTTHEDVHPESIISFDLKDDKFRALPMPSGTLLTNLCTLNADLCAISGTGTGDDYNLYGLWRMENFGVVKQECWTKICSIDCHLAMDKPIAFISPLHVLEDGQILLYAKPKHPHGTPFVVSYNTENNKASFFVQGNDSFMTIPVVYEERLISPNAARLYC